MYKITHTHILLSIGPKVDHKKISGETMKTKIIIATLLLFLIIGAVSAIEFKDTSGCAEDFNELWIDGKKVANITEYNNTSFIDEKILTDNPVIKEVTKDGASEVDSITDYNKVYEFLTDNGFYYTFGKDGKTYVVTIDEKEWKGSMLRDMDEWCLENSK